MSPDPELPSPPALPLAETVTPDQAGAAATEPAGGRKPVHPHCENCGTRLAGPFCHQCGQHDFDIHRSFRHVFLEALDTLFNLEGRFSTASSPCFSPGTPDRRFQRRQARRADAAVPALYLRQLPFANSWIKTVLKAFLLAFGYGLTLGLGFMVMTVSGPPAGVSPGWASVSQPQRRLRD